MEQLLDYKDELSPSAAAWLDNKTLVLVGMMGAGKSTSGRLLARRIGRRFMDSDEEIERAAGGMTIGEIFEQFGEDFFREREERVIARLLEEDRIVLALGGGGFLNERTREALARHALTIWLRADVETIWRRVRRRTTRPLLKTENPRERLVALMEHRAPYFAQADIIVDSSLDAPRVTVDRMLRALEEHVSSR